MSEIKCSFLVLDFKKEVETYNCLLSIKKHAMFPHKIIYLDNGAFDEKYPHEFYKDGLCDVLIRKKNGMGGGYGQTDLIRYCDTPYFFFVQNDQELILDLSPENMDYFIGLLNNGYNCVDLNGDQSRRGAWTDRAHFMKTEFFNSLGPFPNGGPGHDSEPWNESYLQYKFQENNYKIAHIKPAPFKDCGKWSVREAGDGLYKHRCDTKILFVEKIPTYKTEVFPPFNDEEWELALSGNWPKEGKVPELWINNVFKFWTD